MSLPECFVQAGFSRASKLNTMSRLFGFIPGTFYHIYNRGVERRTIFTDKNDYERFVALLYLCNGTKPVVIGRSLRVGTMEALLKTERGEPLVDIGAYCLMPNHFHLLLHEKKQGGISAFMQKLSTAYSMHFNTRQKRSGVLFEGRFKARIVDKEAYLVYLFAYIHLNPVKLIDPTWKEEGISDVPRARDFLQTYQFSSYLDFLGIGRTEAKILERSEDGPFSAYFRTAKDFSGFLESWLSYEEPKGEKDERLHSEAWKAIKPEELNPAEKAEKKK